MPAYFQNLRSNLNTPVGNRRMSNPLDVINTRRNFAQLGRHSEDVERPYMDQELDTTVRTFQRDKGLKEDGLINPNGETERALNRELSEKGNNKSNKNDAYSLPLKLSATVGNNRKNLNDDVKQVQQSFGGLGYLSEAKLYEPSGIFDRETDNGVRKFQQQNMLRVDGFLAPDGETEAEVNIALQKLDSGNTEEEEEDKENDKEEKPTPPAEDDDGKDVPDEEEEEDKEERERQKRCRELSIELQNEKIQIEELNARLEKVLAEINPAEQELREAKKVLTAVGGGRALDTAISGASRGPLGWAGAGAAFMSKSEEVNAAEERVREAREYYEGLLFAEKDINKMIEKTWDNIERIEAEMDELGCS